MRQSKIVYHPDLSVRENAELNNCSQDNIRYYIKTHGIDRRNANKEKIIQAIKDYLKENPDARFSDVAKATHITEMTIRKYWDAAKGTETIKRIGKRKLPKTILEKLNLSASVFRDIFRIEDFDLDIGEPFIGEPVADEIKKQGHNPIDAEGGLFAIDPKKKTDIVSIPPYINDDIVNHCFAVYRKKMALLLPVEGLTDINTHQTLFKPHAPTKIHVYTDKPYMWVVWERGNSGSTQIDWIAQRGRKAAQTNNGTEKPQRFKRQQGELKDEDYEITIFDGVKFKIFKFYDYHLKDIVQFHSRALLENQVMSNHYNCIVTFRGVEFYGFEMLYSAMKFVKHPEILKEIMAASSATKAKEKSHEYYNLYYNGDFRENHFRIYAMCQLFKYLSVKECRDRLRELRGQTLVECPLGHGTSAEATQNLDTNIFHGRNYSGRFTMLIRDMLLPLEDEAIAKKEVDLGRKLTDAEQEKVISEVCEKVREKFENLPQVKADTDAVINYIKDPKNGISLKRKKLKPYVKPVIDRLSKAIVFDFDGCLFDTSADDVVRKKAKGKRDWDAIYKLIPDYKLYDGWRDLLSWAKKNKVKIGVLCDAKGKLVEKAMQHFKLPYDVIVGFQPYVDYPNPIRGNQLQNKLGIREKQVIYIGTNKNAEKQARCNQFKFVGGKWGDNDVMDLDIPLIDNPKEAIDIVKALSV